MHTIVCDSTIGVTVVKKEFTAIYNAKIRCLLPFGVEGLVALSSSANAVIHWVRVN